MYSNPPTSATGTKATLIKNCLLCFKEFNVKNYPGHTSKLQELCCRYLHSAITQNNLVSQSSNQCQPFCPRCFRSAMELVALSDQMEFIQKSLSDFLVMFTLEILHRRGKTGLENEQDSANNINSTKQLIEFDVSALPNSESWSKSINEINIPCTSTINLINERISENIYDDQPVDPLLTDNNAIGEENVEIKTENCETDLDWIDENEMDTNNTGLPTESQETLQSVSTEHVTIQTQTPVVKLKRLEFLGSSRGVVADSNLKYNEQNPGSEKGKLKKTILTRSSSRISCKLNKVDGKRTEETDPKLFPLWSNTSKLNSKPGKSSVSHRGLISEEEKTPKCLKCDVCSDTFKSRRELFRHKRSHMVNLAYKCDFCNKGFKARSFLVTHRRLHTGETPFICSLCPKSFRTQNILRFHHLSYHTKEKPFKCQTCGKGFVQKWILKRHLIVHTNKGKFQCHLCEFSTAQSCLLKIHKIKKHAISNLRNFKCRECETDFETLQLVEEHYRTVHFALEFSDDCIIKKKVSTQLFPADSIIR